MIYLQWQFLRIHHRGMQSKIRWIMCSMIGSACVVSWTWWKFRIMHCSCSMSMRRFCLVRVMEEHLYLKIWQQHAIFLIRFATKCNLKQLFLKKTRVPYNCIVGWFWLHLLIFDCSTVNLKKNQKIVFMYFLIKNKNIFTKY